MVTAGLVRDAGRGWMRCAGGKWEVLVVPECGIVWQSRGKRRCTGREG